jgi:hypothetical protein
MWLRGALCGGSSGGVVVNRSGEAVAMNCEAINPSRTIEEFIEDHKNKEPTKSVDMQSVHSDAITSLSDNHSSSQLCVLLCFSPVAVSTQTM